MKILRTIDKIRINPRKIRATRTNTQMGTMPQTFLLAMIFHFLSGGFSDAAVNAATLT
jgi:hypothetical protein